MKKATTIVLLALCFAAQTAVTQCPGTWQPVPSGLSTELRALHFPAAQDGWAVGAAGKIIRSTDGGITWGGAQTSGTAATLNGVHFVSASTGWAVGHRGIILKTGNGGGTWTPQASNTETDLFDVWFTDAQNGWVVGACGLILRTTDGGQQWAQVSSGKDYNIRQIKVLPNGKGFTTTTGAALIATTNSGANWTGQTTAPRNFRGMDLDAGGLAFAASKDGQLLKSTDYGSTWATATAPVGGGNWEALCMTSATHITLAGLNGQMFRSTDGGTSWADFRMGLDSTDIFGLQMSGDTLGWAVGEGGKVFRFVCAALLPDMIPVPGGTFDMGCFKPNTLCDPKENPVHPVILPDFQIGKYEVTQTEWEAVMGDISPDSIPYAKACGGTCPMEKITWYGATVYCNRLSEQNGLTPGYYTDTAFTQVFGKNGSVWSLPDSGTVHWKKDADGYRLPTEAEWEYAARGGAQSQGFRYAGGNGPNAVAWHKVISAGKPHPVGTKAPNELGLYDMSGNVWELCWDWYGNYSAAAACSPIGPDTGTKRMSRGGSFDNLEDLARVSYRPFFPEPNNGVFDIGFRLAQGKVLPNCTTVLVQPAHAATNVPTNTVLRWAASNPCVGGYRLSLGTVPGGSDILNNVAVADTFYQPAAALPAGQQVYVRVVPFNGAGEASGCGEFGFVIQDTCNVIATASPDTTLCPPAPLTLTASGGTTYQWSDGGPAAAQWTLIPTATKTYTVTATDVNGCTAVDSVQVTVKSNLDCGLVAHYNFDGNAQDSSGYNNHGTPTGSYFWGEDRFGNCGRAIHLNGFYQKGWVRVPSSNSLKFNAKKQMTLSLWVELDQLTGMTGSGQIGPNGFHMLVAKGGDGIATPKGFYYGLNSIGNNLAIGGQNSGPTNNLSLSNLPIHPNYTNKVWKHIAIIATPDSVRLYVDGTLTHKAVSSTNFTDADIKDLLLGIMDGKNSATPSWYPLKGSLDDVRLYNRALSPAEITELYALPNDNPNPAPSAALSTPKTAICPGESTMLTAAPTQLGYTYAWLRDGQPIAGATSSTYTTNQPGAYQVRITATADCDSLSTPLQITSLTPNITALGDTLTCANPVVVLQGNSTTPGATYSWSGPNGFSSTQQNPPVNVAGAYILTVNDPATVCSARDTVVVEAAVGVPSATIATPNGTMLNCTVNSVDLVAPAGAGYTYAWSGGSATNGQQSTVNSPGIYTVTVTDGANGCSATASVIVEKNAATPTAAAAGGELPCKNPFVILQGNSITPNVTYSWSGPNGFAVNQQSPPVSVAGTYTLTVRNPANGCTATATASVAPPQLPTASIAAPSGQQLTCTFTNLPLQAFGGNQYAWAGPSGQTANGSMLTASNPGIYTVTVTTTANGCTNTATTTIGINQNLPLVSATTATLTCSQPTAVISGSSNASGATYVWAGPNGFTANGQQQTANSPGTYTVTATNPANGCTATTTTTVAENKMPPTAAIATPSGASLTCVVSSISLQASGGGGYVWAGPNGFSANGQQQIANSPGAYTVTVTSPTNGCTALATVVVSENKNVPSLSASGGQLSCAQFQAVLQASSSAAGATFKWAGPGGFLVAGQQPTVSSAGTYTCTVTDPTNGCTATQQVTVAPALVLSPSIAPVKAICPGESVVLKASGGFFTYRWSDVLPTLTDSITVSQPGAYIVTVTDANQCVGTASVVVTAAPVPMPIIEGKLAFCSGGSTTLGVVPSGQYLWNGPSGFVFTGQKPAVNVPGIYTVTVTNSEGCTGTRSVNVIEYPSPTAALLLVEETVCAGGVATFVAGGGTQFQFWVNGVAQGGFSTVKNFTLNNPTQGTTVAVYVLSANACVDSTAVGDGAGEEPISLNVQMLPNLSGAFVALASACPKDSVQLLMSLPNLPNGAYSVKWQLDNQVPSTASVFFFNKLGTLTLPPLPPGPHTCTLLSAAVVGTGCVSNWPASTSALNFNMPEPIVTTLNREICHTQSVDFCGKTYSQPGDYTCALTSATGCDSTVMLKLKTVTEFQELREIRLCTGAPYVFYGDTLKQEGLYKKTVAGPVGCDSVVTLGLFYETTTKTSDTIFFCPGTSYAYGTKVFTEPGKYSITLQSIYKCDSIIELTLLHYPISVHFAADEIRVCKDAQAQMKAVAQHCSNCKFKWSTGASGLNLSAIYAPQTATTAQYSVTVTDNKGCTAADTLLLTVVKPALVTRDTLLCPGEALVWCGKSITQAGEYPCTFPTAEDCDSTVTLKVTVFEGQFEAVRDTLSIPLGVLEQEYDVPDKLLQNDSYSGDYDIRIVQQPRLDSVVLEDNGQTLRYILKAGARFGVDSFQYALCPPNGCPEACDSAWVRVRLQNGDLDWVQANMPNFITPDGSAGENDVFDPLEFAKAHGVFPDDDHVQFSIINRWGEVVHRPDTYELWDGLRGRGDNRKPLPQATYYYLLRFTIGEKPEQLRGAVNLLR